MDIPEGRAFGLLDSGKKIKNGGDLTVILNDNGVRQAANFVLLWCPSNVGQPWAMRRGSVVFIL
jgi:hypothetical protein